MGKRAQIGDKRRRKDGHLWEKVGEGKWKRVPGKDEPSRSDRVREWASRKQPQEQQPKSDQPHVDEDGKLWADESKSEAWTPKLPPKAAKLSEPEYDDEDGGMSKPGELELGPENVTRVGKEAWIAKMKTDWGEETVSIGDEDEIRDAVAGAIEDPMWRKDRWGSKIHDVVGATEMADGIEDEARIEELVERVYPEVKDKLQKESKRSFVENYVESTDMPDDRELMSAAELAAYESDDEGGPSWTEIERRGERVMRQRAEEEWPAKAEEWSKEQLAEDLTTGGKYFERITGAADRVADRAGEKYSEMIGDLGGETWQEFADAQDIKLTVRGVPGAPSGTIYSTDIPDKFRAPQEREMTEQERREAKAEASRRWREEHGGE